jgi:hypothetical protein
MEFSAVKVSTAKPLARLLLLSLTLTGSFLLVLGQNPKRIPPANAGGADKTAPATQPGNSVSRSNADETFELNIVERRYAQENFAAATAVGTSSDDQKLNLNIGVALSAGRIDALLRNVHGTVRFRGSLGRIFEIVGDRLTPSPPTSPAPSP